MINSQFNSPILKQEDKVNADSMLKNETYLQTVRTLNCLYGLDKQLANKDTCDEMCAFKGNN